MAVTLLCALCTDATICLSFTAHHEQSLVHRLWTWWCGEWRLLGFLSRMALSILECRACFHLQWQHINFQLISNYNYNKESNKMATSIGIPWTLQLLWEWFPGSSFYYDIRTFLVLPPTWTTPMWHFPQDIIDQLPSAQNKPLYFGQVEGSDGR